MFCERAGFKDHFRVIKQCELTVKQKTGEKQADVAANESILWRQNCLCGRAMRTPAFDLLKTHYDYLDNQSKGYDRTDCDKSSIYLYGIFITHIFLQIVYAGYHQCNADNQTCQSKQNRFHLQPSFHFNNRDELIITATDPALCTSAPRTGFRFPVMARSMAAKLRPIEKIMFSLMVRIMCFDRESR